MVKVFGLKGMLPNLTELETEPSRPLLIGVCWALQPIATLITTFLLTHVLFGLLAQSASGASLNIQNAYTEIYFSPKGGAETAISRNIREATEDISVLAYSFTSDYICDSLILAYKKGVHIRVILDKSQLTAKNSKIQRLKDAGIPLYIDHTHAIAHNKVIIIDRRVAITGSYNFTKSAEERNAENLLIIHSCSLSAKYLQNFELHLEHARAE